MNRFEPPDEDVSSFIMELLLGLFWIVVFVVAVAAVIKYVI